MSVRAIGRLVGIAIGSFVVAEAPSQTEAAKCNPSRHRRNAGHSEQAADVHSNVLLISTPPDRSRFSLVRLARVVLPVLGCALIAMPDSAGSQTYPAKPIRLVVPYPPGGAIDVLARLVAPKMGTAFGQPVVVENRAGADGEIGTEIVARSAPDGYTILLGNTSTHVVSVLLRKKLRYDPVKDFMPITAAVNVVTCLGAYPRLPANSIQDLVEFARRNPGKLSYGSNGVGSSPNLYGELLKKVAGLDILHVPYKGAGQALADVMSGEIHMLFIPVGQAMPHMRSGKLRILAIQGPKRYAALPDVPTLMEAIPGMQSPFSWFGFFAPAGLPRPLLARLHAEIVKALNASDVRGALEQAALPVIGNTPEQFAAMIAEGFESFGIAVKAAGFKIE